MKTMLSLKIMFLYATKTEVQEAMYGGRKKFIEAPTGEVHICLIHEVEGGHVEPDIAAICTIERTKIGKNYKYSDKRPNNLPMCPKCEARWKTHPASPWTAWQSGKPLIAAIIALAFVTLACMTSAGEPEVGTAAASTPPSITEGTPFAHPEDPAGAVFDVPEAWEEPSGYQLCAIVTASQSLHLRSEPSENSQVIEWLLSGEEIKVKDPTGAWWQVETISGKKGYAKSKYLEAGKCR